MGYNVIGYIGDKNLEWLILDFIAKRFCNIPTSFGGSLVLNAKYDRLALLVSSVGFSLSVSSAASTGALTGVVGVLVCCM